MARLWPVCALAGLLIATAFFAGVPGLGRALPSSGTTPAAPPPGSDTVQATDQFGAPQTVFYVGLISGAVYFAAYDPNTADSSATVALVDQNASSDHQRTPVASVVVTFTPANRFNDSWTWGFHFTIPFNVTIGGAWNLTITAVSAGVNSGPLYVRTYGFGAAPVVSPVLAGHTATVRWAAQASVNGAPYTPTNITISGVYQRGATFLPLFTKPVALPVVWFGSYNFTIPATATANTTVFLNLWAQTFRGSVLAENESTTTSVVVGYLIAGFPTGFPPTPGLRLCSPPGTCSAGPVTFAAGVPVFAVALASISSVVPAPGELVSFQFFSAGRPVSPPGNPPTSLTTNATGMATVSFFASNTTFSSSAVNSVSVTFTDPVNRSMVASASVSFTILPSPQFAYIQVSTNSLQYFSGDTVTATWAVGSSNSSQVGPIVPYFWEVFDIATSEALVWATMTPTGNTGQFTFSLPSSYTGIFELVVFAHNQTASFVSFPVAAEVSAPQLLVTPSETLYNAGDAITVKVTTLGQAFASATLWETTADFSGVIVGSGQVTGGQFTFAVPSGAPSTRYTFTVWAQSATAGTFATKTATVVQAIGLELLVGIATVSNYADGSYQPGQTVQISYNVKAVGPIAVPKSYTLQIGFFDSFEGIETVQVSSPSGTVPFTIPSNTPAGTQLIVVTATPSLTGYFGFFAGIASMNVNPSPSAFNYELGAGSGVTVGWVVLLVIVFVVALLTYVAIRRRGRGGSRMVMTPASSTPSGPPPAAWQESPPSGGGSMHDESSEAPPMPNAPPGSS